MRGGGTMDSSMIERWLKVTLYGMVLLNRPSVNNTGPKTIRAPTSSSTTDSGPRAGKSPSSVCSRQARFGEEVSFPGAEHSSLPESYELENEYYKERVSRHESK
jgi:hypothetical protein